MLAGKETHDNCVTNVASRICVDDFWDSSSPMDLGVAPSLGALHLCQEEMFQRTHIPEARWWVIEGVDKKRARLNCIHHLLQHIRYGDVQHEPIAMPDSSISRITRATRFPRRCMCRQCISFSLRSPRGERSQLHPFTLAVYRPSGLTTLTIVPKSWPTNSTIPRLSAATVFSSHISGQTRNRDCGCLPYKNTAWSGFSAAT